MLVAPIKKGPLSLLPELAGDAVMTKVCLANSQEYFFLAPFALQGAQRLWIHSS